MNKTNKKYKLTDIQLIKNYNDNNNDEKVTFKLSTKKSRKLTVNERNKNRLAFRKIESTISLDGFKRHTEWHPYFYLSELIQQQSFELFDKESRKYKKTFERNHDVLGLILLKDAELERKIGEGVLDRKNIENIQSMLRTQLDCIKELKTNFEWRCKAYNALLSSIDKTIKPLAVETKKPVNKWQKIYGARYDLYRGKSIDEKINALKRLYELTFLSNASQLKREHAAACSNLATYYMILQQFDTAMFYYDRALKHRKYFRPASFYTLQYNFVGLLLRNMQFETAYEAMLKVDSDIQKLPSVAFKWQLLKCMCYVFAGKEKEIKNILPAVPAKKVKTDYIYFYVIWSIYFTRTGKSETALQMIDTALKLCKRHGGEAGMQLFLDLLKKYHVYHDTFNRKTAAQKTLEHVKKINLAEFSAGNILPLVWLNKFLTNEL